MRLSSRLMAKSVRRGLGRRVAVLATAEALRWLLFLLILLELLILLLLLVWRRLRGVWIVRRSLIRLSLSLSLSSSI